MNTVLIQLNSYIGQAKVYLNGSEPSSYSELSNYSYQQFIHDPAEILAAIARELNDEFALQVCANAFLFRCYLSASSTEDLCLSCTSVTAALPLSSSERALRLGNALPTQELTAFITGDGISEPEDCPDRLSYGNLTVKILFAAPEEPFTRIDMGHIEASRELLISACEAFVIDPIIGATATGSPSIEISICGRMDPILSASAPLCLEVGTQADVQICVYPDSCPPPDVVIRASNSDVITVQGLKLSAISPGTATINVFVRGDNRPFFSQEIVSQKHVYVSRIEITDFAEPLCEGASVPISAKVFPEDAEDSAFITWDTSDSDIAEVKDGQLLLKKAGTCSVVVKTDRLSSKTDITILPKLRSLTLSHHDISLNVGQKAPVCVDLGPPDAFDGHYTWKSTDKTVAIVEKGEDGRELVKAVGIGTCMLTCAAQSGAISDQCAVTVKSIMYQKKKRSFWPTFLSLAVIAALVLVCLKSCVG